MLAQWKNLPARKTDLSAPAPRSPDGHPDLSGIWEPDANRYLRDIAVDLKPGDVPFQPWAKALYEQRTDGSHSKEDPDANCLPQGVPKIDAAPAPWKIVQTPGFMVIVYEAFNLWRQVFMDGRELDKDANPTWMGYSVGHWDGDTLVIESSGFNDRTWIDGGHPHTEALRMTERLRRPDFGHLELVRTLVDPGAFEGAWTVPLKFELDADTEDLEYVCNENERDRQHLVGKESDEKSVPVDPGILKKYVGTYEFTDPTSHQVFKLIFTLDKDHLVFGGMGSSVPLVSASNTDFTGGGATFKFVANDAGAVTYALFQTVEGDFKAIRK